VPLSRGAGTPSSTMWPRLRSTFRAKWRLHPSSRLATIYMNRKLWGCALFRRELRPHLTQRHPRPRFTSVPSGILIHAAVWPPAKNSAEVSVPFSWGELGAHRTQCRLGRGLSYTSIPSGILVHPVVWPQRTLAENWGRGCAPLGRGAGCPSNIMSRQASAEVYLHIPSDILIHAGVWPQ